jgi:N-acetylglucosaminyldiphosphoundecaprenol N-acetyl-beta-D-mannosaminyltransferase
MRNKSTKILNVNVSAINYQDTLKKVQNIIKKRQKKYICVCAVHLIMECQTDPGLLEAVNQAALVTPDGMPLVWLNKLYGNKKTERVYGPSLMLKLCQQASQKKWSIFLLGGIKGQSNQLKNKLIKIYPKLRVVGQIDTPQRPISFSLNKKIIQKINHKKPDIIFVGLGCPHQEKWMADNIHKIKTHLTIGVGAAFDFISDRKKQAPFWMQSIGLEWLFRLLQEPKRLAYRYLILNSKFIIKISQQIINQTFNT